MNEKTLKQNIYHFLICVFFAQCFAVLGIAVGILGGCASGNKGAPIISRPIVVEAEADRLWQVSQEQIKRTGFTLDKVDRRGGVIQTYPLTSKQWFEFWCHDVVTFDDLAVSSLQSIRRIVIIEFEPLDENRFEVKCMVNIEKIAGDPAVISGQVQASDILGETIGRVPAANLPGPRSGEVAKWYFVGRDQALEAKILDSIKNLVCPEFAKI
ncbi:MAG: hypothetical protein JXD22_06335 [Sedimentisphaerales bacterium]|nr:hypothetical protein [Sedimentisphaerales bacterium]